MISCVSSLMELGVGPATLAALFSATGRILRVTSITGIHNRHERRAVVAGVTSGLLNLCEEVT
jgi:hypothetical protein